MKYENLTLTLGVLGLLSAPLGALTVDDAVNQARSHNLGLQTEDLKVAQKADEKNFSFNRLYPTISTSASLARLNNLNLTTWEKMWPYVHNSAAPSSFDAIGDALAKEDNHWALATNVSVQFVWNPAVFRGIVQTMVDYDNAQVSRQAAAARLDRDVRKMFYQLLALHEATDVFQNQLTVAEARWKLAKDSFDAGLGSEISALQAQVSFENRKPVVADQKLAEQTAQAGFRLLLNVPDNAPLTLEGNLDVPADVRQSLAGLDVEALVKRYLEGRWDVVSAEGTAKSLGNLAQLQADSLWPSFVFGWTADPSVSAPFASSTWTDANAKYRWVQNNGALTMTLAWKLDGFLPGSTTGIDIAGKNRSALQAQIGVEQTRRAGENEIRTLVGKLKKSAVSLEGLQLALELAQKSSKLTGSAFKTGNQSFNDAQDADLQLQTARLQYLNEELALQSALADLDYALAADRDQWLKAGIHG